MSKQRKILILGASYGSLLASKLLFAGHEVKLIPRGAGLFIQGKALAELRHRLSTVSDSPHNQSRRGA